MFDTPGWLYVIAIVIALCLAAWLGHRQGRRFRKDVRLLLDIGRERFPRLQQSIGQIDTDKWNA